ncbi:MAG: hypothetical protein AAFU85_12975, partial [Planctomycetota bacterium]
MHRWKYEEELKAVRLDRISGVTKILRYSTSTINELHRSRRWPNRHPVAPSQQPDIPDESRSPKRTTLFVQGIYGKCNVPAGTPVEDARKARHLDGCRISLRDQSVMRSPNPLSVNFSAESEVLPSESTVSFTAGLRPKESKGSKWPRVELTEEWRDHVGEVNQWHCNGNSLARAFDASAEFTEQGRLEKLESFSNSPWLPGT